MAKFIKLVLLVEDSNGKAKEEPTLIDLADIHSFRKNSDGKVMVFYKERDSADGLQWNDYIKDAPSAITAALAKDGVEIISL